MKIKYINVLFFCLLIFFKAEANKKDSIRVKGKISDYDVATNPVKNLQFSVYELAFDDNVNYLAKINADGTFYISIPSAKLESVQCKYDDGSSFGFYAGPDGDVYCSFEVAKLVETLRFTGMRAKLNNDLHLFNIELRKRTTDIYKQTHAQEPSIKTSPEKYKEFQFKIMEDKLAYARGFENRHNEDVLFEHIVTANIKYSTGYDMMIEGFGNIETNTKTDYYKSILVKLPPDKRDDLISPVYAMYLHNYNYYLNSKVPMNNSKQLSLSELANLVLTRGKSLKPDEIALLNKLTENNNNTVHLSKDGIHFSLKLSLDHIPNQLSKSDSLLMDKMFNANSDLIFEKSPHPIAEYYNRKQGWVRDVFLSWALTDMINTNRVSQVKQYLNIYKTTVKDAGMKNKVLDLYKEKSGELHNASLSTASYINGKLDISTDSLLNKLVAKYAGKVVYIDFWGTWCIPCIDEMPGSKQLNESMKGKAIVFLYLGVNSPGETWKQVIAKLGIKGEHYLLNGEEYKYLSTKLQFNSLPHYALVNKQGLVVSNDALRPTNPNLKTQIETLLN